MTMIGACIMDNKDVAKRKKENFIDTVIEISIVSQEKTSKEKIQAKSIGNLAVHEGVRISGYVISEISTGFALFKGFRTIKDAMYVARYIYEIYGNVPVDLSRDILAEWGQIVATDVRTKFMNGWHSYFDCYNLPKGISSQGRKRINNE